MASLRIFTEFKRRCRHPKPDCVQEFRLADCLARFFPNAKKLALQNLAGLLATRTRQALESRSREEDLRATPEFSRLRHEVWSLLRDEFRQAEILERNRVSGAAAAA
jgi:hypothetical protein